MNDVRCRVRLHQWRYVRQIYSHLFADDERYTTDGRLIFWEDEYACQRCHVHEMRVRAGHRPLQHYVPPDKP